MPSRTSRRTSDRAEARRRARLASRGLDPDEEPRDDDEEDGEAASAPPGRGGGGFLSRLFPPAPPLPNKPDPLAGFEYGGPLSGIVAGFYLLGRNPIAWLATGALWSVGRTLTQAGMLGLTNSLLAIIASLFSFGALIGAGWLGWQRPWLFGLAAALLGMVIYSAVWAALLAGNPGIPPALEVFLNAMTVEFVGFQPFFGVLAGWYGGYLRRRMAATSASARRSRPRR